MESHPTFEVLQQIGSGESATVFRARDLELKRYVAIKVLHEKLRKDPWRSEQFLLEARVLAGLEHDSIVQVHGLDKERGWIIMELMRGGLDAKLAEGPLAPDLVRSVLRQALGALDYLHGQRRLHGAIKPSNLLINDQGRVKVSDAKGAEIGGQVKKPTGLPKYLPPELLKPEFGPMGPPSDLYALGFTALELLVGAKFDSLFPGVGGGAIDPALAWMRWHSSRTDRLSPVRELVPGVPRDLAAVIDRLLTKETSERYGTAGEALKDLENRPIVLVEPPISAAPVPEPHRPHLAAGSAPAPIRPAVKVVKAAPAWSREWINQKLSDRRVFIPVIGLIVAATGLVLWNDLAPRKEPQKGKSAAVDKPRQKRSLHDPGHAGEPPKVALGPRTPEKVAPTEPKADGDGGPTIVANDSAQPGSGSPTVNNEGTANPAATRKDMPTPARKPKKPPPVDRKEPPRSVKNQIGMEFVLIPAGEFLMGSPDGEGDASEHPQHAVRIAKPYYIGTTEVTQDQYKAMMGENPSRFTDAHGERGGDGALPVESVEFEKCAAFCAALAKRENLPPGTYRLPTEAEWECAARGGPAARSSPLPGPDELGASAWFTGNADQRTHAVGLKAPTSLGLFDMAGNVWEWCSDWYAEDAYARPNAAEPGGPPDPGPRPMRVLRGGSFIAHAGPCRFTDRYAAPPSEAVNCFGFRVVREVTAAEGGAGAGAAASLRAGGASSPP
jgi:formylglycine-generating enzyme required for sulfatase activity/serine/threonine protein kinase